MIKTAKKLLGILLALSMMFSLYVPVIAAETGSIIGDTQIYAPPIGSYSIVTYQLKNAGGNIVENAVFTLNSAPDGVVLSGNNLILNGTEIKSGTISLSAASEDGSVIANPIEIIVYSDRVFFDATGRENTDIPSIKPVVINTGAESACEGFFKVPGSYISSTQLLIKKESSGNEYFYFDDDAYVTIDMSKVGLNTAKTQKITLEAKLKYHGDYISGSYFTLLSVNDGNDVLLRHKSGEKKILSRGNSTGEDLQDAAALDTGVELSASEWTDVRLILDYSARTYTLYLNGEEIYKDYKMLVKGTNAYLANISVRTKMDDFAVYSGIEAESANAGSLPERIAVGSRGVKMPLPSDGQIKLVNGTVIDSDVKWSTESTGVSVDGKYLIIPESLKPEDGVEKEIILVADIGGIKKSYTIDLCAALEETSNVTVPTNVLGGISVIKATLSGSNVVLKGLGKDINITGTDLSVYIDGFEKSYIVICDKKTVDKGSYTTLSDISLENATVTELYAGGIYDEAPMALDARLSTDPIVGQNVGVSYTYFSKLYEKTGHEITWTLRNGESVEETRTADTFTIEKPMTGKTLQASVIVRGGGKESETFYTETKTIKDVYNVSLNGNSVNVEILSIEEEAENEGFIIGVEWMKDGQSVGTLAKAIEYVGSLYTITADTAIDDARVWLMYNNLTPIAGDKYASGSAVSYESSGKTQNGLSYEDGSLYVYDTSGGMTTVIVYKPAAEADFAESKVFPFGILGDSGEVELNDYISYMGVIAPDAKLSIDTSLGGIYKAAALTQSGEVTAEFIIGKEKLFTQNKLQTLTEAQFDKVMTLTGATADYDEYQKAEPGDISTLMHAEDYDMAELKTAILVSAFLEDKANKETLTAHLKERTLPTAGAELLTKNLDFAASAALVKLDGGIEKALESMFETAILQGVAKSGNYLETKPYLEAAGDYTVSDAMALSFTGKPYGTLTELKAAIEGYTETPSGSDVLNPDSTESTGGSLTGSSPAGGIVGGNGGGGGGGSSSSEKESDTEDEIQASGTIAFNDVSSAHWAYEDIAYLVRKEIISGMGDGSFAPDSSITRAQYVKILAGAFPMNEIDDAAEFTDVDKSAWYYSFIKKASAAGIVNGDGQCFRPDASITRQDAAVMLYRVLSALNVRFDDTQCDATDSSDISSYALQAVNSLYGAGIINGMADGSFKPKNNITRAQAAAIVARVLK